ncbi:MAG TPA: bifunctional UDP-N-acetylglucosamine diphosphorylase/glucosamine-1-phosphate N-acetyltransferase GlmU [Alphaproteobacteria bacterium]
MSDLNCIILAAGKGTRMKSDMPKVLHALGGWPMIRHVVKSCEALEPAQITVVIAPGMGDVAKEVAPHATSVQEKQLGSGDAARAGLKGLKDPKGKILILAGDVPLISVDTLQALVEEAETGMSVLGFTPMDPTGYGRLITDDDLFVTEIIEERDASAGQKNIALCNAGAYCIDAKLLPNLLDKLSNSNAQKEFYLTDIVSLAAKSGIKCAYIEAPIYETIGINSRSQLAEAEGELQNYLRAKAMFEGASLLDPMTTYFAMDTKLGQDVIIEPGVFFGPGVVIGDKVTIHAYSYLEGVTVERGASIGPFARIRPHSHIGEDVSIGNFIEVNRSTLKAGAKSKHLSYLGDAVIGEKANIGAGTVIANYDGFDKLSTEVGKDAFVGSNSTLIAPVKIGDGAYVGAASAITEDVPAGSLALARARTIIRDGWAALRNKEKTKTKKAG